RSDHAGRSRVCCSRILDDFFFSSRRRHTRLQGDWSSDVCSSDLVTKMIYDQDIDPAALEGQTIAVIGYGSQGEAHARNVAESGQERKSVRVGKEVISRWVCYHLRR